MYDASQAIKLQLEIARQSKQNKTESGSSIDSGEWPSSAIEIIPSFCDYHFAFDSTIGLYVTHKNGWNNVFCSKLQFQLRQYMYSYLEGIPGGTELEAFVK